MCVFVGAAWQLDTSISITSSTAAQETIAAISHSTPISVTYTGTFIHGYTAGGTATLMTLKKLPNSVLFDVRSVRGMQNRNAATGRLRELLSATSIWSSLVVHAAW